MLLFRLYSESYLKESDSESESKKKLRQRHIFEIMVNATLNYKLFVPSRIASNVHRNSVKENAAYLIKIDL